MTMVELSDFRKRRSTTQSTSPRNNSLRSPSLSSPQGRENHSYSNISTDDIDDQEISSYYYQNVKPNHIYAKSMGKTTLDTSLTQQNSCVICCGIFSFTAIPVLLSIGILFCNEANQIYLKNPETGVTRSEAGRNAFGAAFCYFLTMCICLFFYVKKRRGEEVDFRKLLNLAGIPGSGGSNDIADGNEYSDFSRPGRNSNEFNNMEGELSSMPMGSS